MSLCLSCAQALPTGEQRYHEFCLLALFDTKVLPAIHVDMAKLHTLALAMVGRVSVSGVQRKLSLHLDATRSTLQIVGGPGGYLLKPPAGTFPHLPENEWTTQCLAALVGLAVPPCALVALPDDSWAYIVRRFDRLPDGTKLAMEDFCQLSELPPCGKYDGSAEQCAKHVRRFASEPLIDLLRLYRQFVFTWWVGNGDLHLKNFALLRNAHGRWSLSPAYDQLNTGLVIPGDTLALPICGKSDRLKPKTWDELATRFGIGMKAARRVRDELRDHVNDAVALVEASPLPAEMRAGYAEQLQSRGAGL
ncbi:MAG: serine/threonine-protein kinase HipA [Pseudohongiellaceae bacterium]